MSSTRQSTRRHFNPRSPRGERRPLARQVLMIFVISIHAPRVGSDRPRLAHPEDGQDFNPRSPRGERPLASDTNNQAGLFQSTLPAWGATTASRSYSTVVKFQSTLPAWGATHGKCLPRARDGISIHAPRVGSDVAQQIDGPREPDISIHAPRVGSDFVNNISRAHLMVFQSTLPAWGATRNWLVTLTCPPISIHAPRVGSDTGWPLLSTMPTFQSTLPAWGATRLVDFLPVRQDISIHAPRVGSDRAVHRDVRCAREISIHAPRVGSDSNVASLFSCSNVFQSTLPAWGATCRDLSLARRRGYFNPRSPRGERLK